MIWSWKPTALCSVLLLITSLLLTCSAKEQNTPGIARTEIENAPTSLFYFEDSNRVLLHDRYVGKVLLSKNGGKDWEDVDQIKEAVDAFWHPYDNKVAYVVDMKKHIYITYDRAESWERFDTHIEPMVAPLSFHATDNKKLLFRGQKCDGLFCEEVTYYTINGFKTVEKLRDQTQQCLFAHSTQLLSAANKELDNRIMCVVRTSLFAKDHRLQVSDNFFVDEQEPYLDEGRTVQGIINVAAVKGYIVTAAKAEHTDELALYVTADGDRWHKAIFPHDHKLEEDAYTILESTNYSIQVDVKTTRREPMGVLFSSNSNGTYFTRNIEHTNRDNTGTVDFEKIQAIQGIVLVNTIDNWKAVEKTTERKKIQSKISFDDGRTFGALKAKKGGALHLHSVTDMANMGKVFSSPAPGLVMGVGNTGEFLRPYEEGDLWVSDDAGLTWSHALEEAHIFAFGDSGSVLMAVYNEGPTDEIRWSLDHGKTWETTGLEEKVKARLLTTTPDATALTFLLYGNVGGGRKLKHVIYAFDFGHMHERTCKEEDFEQWYARADEGGEAGCVMGATQHFRRRRKNADCFVKDKYNEPLPKQEACPCSAEDFECDAEYIRSKNGKSCEPADTMSNPEGTCQKVDDTFKGPSGFRKIPGNICDRKAEGATVLDNEIDRPCKDSAKAPPSGEVSHTTTSFEAGRFQEYYYLERTASSEGEDETVVFRDDQKHVWLSRDHGKHWNRILEDDEIQLIRPHPYFNDFVYFHTSGTKTHYSSNRGKTFDYFEAEEDPNPEIVRTLGFHADNKNWMIWNGVSCKRANRCHTVAKITTDRGDHWETLLRYVKRCEFIKKEGRGESEKLVYCEQYRDENPRGPLELKSSDNWFTDSKTHFSNILEFATMSEFIIVAVKSDDDKDTLKVSASIDGKTFADAQWPPNFDVPAEKAYTVLDSSTHAAFLLVSVSNREGSEYGSIVKSNSNGTSYVLSIDSVNRDSNGYADFEKLQVIEGVALLNIVDNTNEARKGNTKKLKTLITHNDGAQWAALKAPKVDAEGHDFGCDVDDPNQCSLHLHGYTERRDHRHTYSSSSAVGLVMGVGNVGSHLTRKASGDLFMSRDGGISWTSIRKGPHMWEYGDQGSVIVIVEELGHTNIVSYSLDEGKSWKEYAFAGPDEKMAVESISTVPSDSSLNFLLWARSGGDIKTINLDFSGLNERQKICNMKEDLPSNDYYPWEPSHPLQEDKCLFGHVTQYHRKNIDANCYNGRWYEKLLGKRENCSCTRQDFEW